MIEDKLNDVSSDKQYTKAFLTSKLNNKKDPYFTWNTAEMLIELLMFLVILDKQNELEQWIDITSTYYNEFQYTHVNEIQCIEIEYYRYLLSLVRNNPSDGILESYANKLKAYYGDRIPVNKANKIQYRELIITLLEAGQYEECNSLCEECNTRSINDTIIQVLYKYSANIGNIEGNAAIVSYVHTINRQRQSITRSYLNAVHYYSIYYKEMIKSNSAEKVFKSLILGIN